jgi:ribosomal protein L29
MIFSEIKGLSTDELKKKLAQAREDFFSSKMKNHLGQLPNPMGIRELRRNVARLHTAIKMKGN